MCRQYYYIKNSTTTVAFAILASFILTATVLPAGSTGQSINLKDGNTITTSPTYDGYSRYWEVQKAFSIQWFENIRVYFKIQSSPNNEFYKKGDIVREQGWFVSFTIADANGKPLKTDAMGNTIDPNLGTRTDAEPSDLVWIKPDTTYTMIARIHIPTGLVAQSDYMGTILVCTRINTTTSGSGSTMDESEEVLCVITPDDTYLLYGSVTYKGEGQSNASVTIRNERTGESVHLFTNKEGSYIYDLSSLMRGWKRGDRVRIEASNGGRKASQTVTLDINKNSVEANIELSETSSEPVYGYIAAIVITIILLAIFVLYKRGILPLKKTENNKKAPRKGNGPRRRL